MLPNDPNPPKTAVEARARRARQRPGIVIEELGLATLRIERQLDLSPTQSLEDALGKDKGKGVAFQLDEEEDEVSVLNNEELDRILIEQEQKAKEKRKCACLRYLLARGTISVENQNQTVAAI